MNTFNTTEEYYDALNKEIHNGKYGKLKHPEMADWFANSESANSINEKINSMIDTLDALSDTKWAAIDAYSSFKYSMNRITISAKYPTISELPAQKDITAIDDSYDTIMNIVNTNKEDDTMKDIKDQMQESINECNNTISFDEFDAKTEEATKRKINAEITDGEEKIISSPRQNNIADLCNIVNIASTAALVIKSCRTKKNIGKYRVSDLACITLSSYITGQSIRETYQDFPDSRFGKLYHNTIRFIKKVVEAAKKLTVKTTRKENNNYEER